MIQTLADWFDLQMAADVCHPLPTLFLLQGHGGLSTLVVSVWIYFNVTDTGIQLIAFMPNSIGIQLIAFMQVE